MHVSPDPIKASSISPSLIDDQDAPTLGLINVVRDGSSIGNRVIARLTKIETGEEVVRFELSSLGCGAIASLELGTPFLLEFGGNSCLCKGEKIVLTPTLENPLIHVVVCQRRYSPLLGLGRFYSKIVDQEELESIVIHSQRKRQAGRGSFKGIFVAGTVAPY
jgi:hypothetical protein